MRVSDGRTAQRPDFSLAEIGRRVPELWDQAEPGPAIARVLQEKRQEIDPRIALPKGPAQPLALACRRGTGWASDVSADLLRF